ncbi:leucine-rich repeat domain-containing protein [Histomonas meleagridis]|uniref:leucine-rich repeat domain-containing protein n=1 Tax=Histomonas meleagridis TaxID=135588 RepID=UPI00355A7892|nr:leucine-rich repeat domain-containing protein [Histomonas meleagridis]KAH0804743.1 leucine-rich repeat domain-containing protein [Histomonas meleagridis]
MSFEIVTIDPLTYSLHNNGEAVLIRSPQANNKGDIIVPKVIQHEGKQFFVTEIGRKAFSRVNINSLSFEEGSCVRKFCKDCFSQSHIKSLTIPPSLQVLEPGWSSNIDQLNDIQLAPGCTNFSFSNGMLFSADSTLLFLAVRNITNVVVPRIVQEICDCAFENCKKIESFTFDFGTVLRHIGRKSLSSTSIKSIEIPNTTADICYAAFFNSRELTELKFSPYSQLSVIEDSAFQAIGITSIVIPASVLKIGSYAFYYCKDLTSIIFEPDSKLYHIGSEAFRDTSIIDIEFPEGVTYVPHLLFRNCLNLRIVDFMTKNRIFFEAKSFYGAPASINIIIYDKSLIDGTGAPREQITTRNGSDASSNRSNSFTFSPSSSLSPPASSPLQTFGRQSYNSPPQSQPLVSPILDNSIPNSSKSLNASPIIPNGIPSSQSESPSPNLQQVIPQQIPDQQQQQMSEISQTEEQQESTRHKKHRRHGTRSSQSVGDDQSFSSQRRRRSSKQEKSIKSLMEQFQETSPTPLQSGPTVAPTLPLTNSQPIVTPQSSYTLPPPRTQPQPSIPPPINSLPQPSTTNNLPVIPPPEPSTLPVIPLPSIPLPSVPVIPQPVSSNLPVIPPPHNFSIPVIPPLNNTTLPVIPTIPVIPLVPTNVPTIELPKVDIPKVSVDDQLNEMEQIGTGFMTSVFKVSSSDGHIFALKHYRNKSTASESIEKIKSDYEKLGNHPYILPIYDIKLKNGQTLAVMEYVNSNLRKAIESESLSAPQKAVIISEIVGTMKYINRKIGPILSLKPENILIDSKGDVRIAGIGDKYFDDEDDILGKGSNSLLFNSPELLSQEDLTEKADVYSFGMLVYFIVSSIMPKFNLQILMNGKLMGQIKTQLSSTQGIGSFVEPLVERCLNMEPSERPSFEEIAEILKSNNFQIFQGIDQTQPMTIMQTIENLD